MPANTAIPFFRIGQDITGLVVTAAVTGKRFVIWAVGGRPGQPAITVSTVGVRPAGVAGHDQAVGGYVHVLHGGVVPIVAAADILANAQVQVAADGKVVTLSTGVAVGTCIANVTAGDDAAIHLSL